MATTINADTSTGGVVLTGDGSGVLELQAAGVTKATLNSSGMTLATPLPVASGGTGAASLSGITTGTATNLAGGSNGTIPYQSASGTTQMLAVGTSGQLLQSNGAAAPTWVAASSGALTLLSTVTASNSATVDIETTFSSTYDSYMLVATGITVGVDYSDLKFRMKLGGTYLSTGYYYHTSTSSSTSGTYSGDGTSNTNSVRFLNSIGTGTGKCVNLTMRIYAPSSTTLRKLVDFTGGTVDVDNLHRQLFGGGSNTSTDALTGIRFFLASGNIVAGTFRLYGIANS